MKDSSMPYAYDKFYLSGIFKITRFLLHIFIHSGHDYFGCIKEYMGNSSIRRKMDEGNWSALNKGIKQLCNSVDVADVPGNDNAYMDEIMSDWISDIYVYMQWKYKLVSADIVKHLPPELLYDLYHPLHETGIDSACDKLYKRYENTVAKEEVCV